MNYETICFHKQEYENMHVNEYFLLIACESGYVDWIQWLCYYDMNISLSMKNQLPFLVACESENLEIILHLLNKDKELLFILKDYLYQEIMLNNYGFVMFIYNKIPHVFELFTNKEMLDFFYNWYYDNEDMTQWFCETFSFIHIVSNNHEIFINAYESQDIRLIKLLNFMRPDCYYIEMFDDMIQSFEINYSVKPGKTIEKKMLSIDKCYICYENANIITSCNHYYCKECIEKHYESNSLYCPYCRKENYEYQLCLII